MIDTEKVIEAFLGNWDGPVAEPLWCLADALREIAETFHKESLVEVGEEFERVAGEIELNATKQ